MTKSAIVIIPARYNSTRFPGKLLEMLGDYNVVQRVYLKAEQAQKPFKVIVATDHKAIRDSILDIGGNAVITSGSHLNGTSRIAEVAIGLSEYDYVVNVQGDEPFINPQIIDDLILELSSSQHAIISCMQPCKTANEMKEKNIVKVMVDHENMAIDFKRKMEEQSYFKENIYRHIGIYGFKASILQKLVSLPVSAKEEELKLEQLRWIDNHYTIKMIKSSYNGFGIDTPEDLLKARLMINAKD